MRGFVCACYLVSVLGMFVHLGEIIFVKRRVEINAGSLLAVAVLAFGWPPLLGVAIVRAVRRGEHAR
jgi:hypothetical protein